MLIKYNYFNRKKLGARFKNGKYYLTELKGRDSKFLFLCSAGLILLHFSSIPYYWLGFFSDNLHFILPYNTCPYIYGILYAEITKFSPLLSVFMLDIWEDKDRFNDPLDSPSEEFSSIMENFLVLMTCAECPIGTYNYSKGIIAKTSTNSKKIHFIGFSSSSLGC